MLRPFFAAALTLAIAASTSSAQERVPDNSAWSAVAEALGPGTFVAVRTKDGTRIKGTLIKSSQDGILLQPRTRIPVPPREVAFSAIESLERTGKPKMSPGVKVVLGVGIGAGVVLLASALIFAASGY